MSDWISAVAALLSLALSLVALGMTRRIRLTLGGHRWVSDHYEIELVNGGDQVAKHVGVYLVDAAGEAGPITPGTAITSGERKVLSVFTPEGPAKPPYQVKWHYKGLLRQPITKRSTVQLDGRQSGSLADGATAGEGHPGPSRAYVSRSRATPEAIWERLSPWDDLTPGRLDGTWEDKLQRDGGRHLIGQVCSPSGWDGVPLGLRLHVVAVQEDNGVCLRWASSAAGEILGSVDHRQLHRGEPREARKGFMTRDEYVQVDN